MVSQSSWVFTRLHTCCPALRTTQASLTFIAWQCVYFDLVCIWLADACDEYSNLSYGMFAAWLSSTCLLGSAITCPMDCLLPGFQTDVSWKVFLERMYCCDNNLALLQLNSGTLPIMLPRGLAWAFVLILVAHHSLLVSGAYAAVCCSTGHLDYQVTKDCCTAVANGQKGWTAAQQHFEEASHNCISNNIGGGNSVNDGDVAACCKSRGCSSASSSGGPLGNDARIGC